MQQRHCKSRVQRTLRRRYEIKGSQRRHLLEHLESRFLLAGDLIISGVIDGPLSGGTPKAIELYATSNIADLGRYAVGSANNGGGTDGPELILSGSATAGQFFYIASEATEFANFFGFSPDFTSSAANINGDDAIELFFDADADGITTPAASDDMVIDVFGEIDVDGTGQPWEHLDGWAYRVDNTGPDGNSFDATSWTFSGINALDGESNNAGASTPFPVGTYASSTSPTIQLPEIEISSGSVIANGDDSPASSDGTDFGSVVVGVSESRTFTVSNIGDASLNLTGAPLVSVSGSTAFSVSTQPASNTIAPNGSMSFTIVFIPDTAGTASATISVANSDADENPYTFAVSGKGVVAAAPQILIRGNGQLIGDGDSEPSVDDGTDFGTVNTTSSKLQTFVIDNSSGSATLTIDDITISATDASVFTVANIPANVPAGSSAEFDVTFSPSVNGPSTATVVVESNDSDTGMYDFGIRGVGKTVVSGEPGSVVFSEVMQNPSAVNDSVGEYFELWNTTSEPIDIDGWIIRDDATESESHTIDNGGSLVISPDGYLLLAVEGDTAINGGLSPDYVYSRISLGNGLDGLILTDAAGTTIDQVTWDDGATFPDPTGASMEFVQGSSNPATANDTGANWQTSTNLLPSGDSGTPGAANSASDPDEPDEPDGGTGTASILLDKFLWDINGSPALHHQVQVGDELIYSFNVTNDGEEVLTNVSVTDPLPGLVMDEEVAEPYIAYQQPALIPDDGILGPFASVDRELASDPFEAKAWDNFSFDDFTVIDALTWTGAYVEPFAMGLTPLTDFLIEVFSDDNGTPGTVQHSFHVDGGAAGVNDANVVSKPLAHTAENGGPAFEYMAMLPFTLLDPGEYWLAITALQTFPNPAGVIDPTWQWHLGSASGDGIFSYDDTFDDAGDNNNGEVDTEARPTTFEAGKDLAFTWHASRLVDFDGSLQPGEMVMFMGTYYVTQADIDAGGVTNTATANADSTGGQVSSSDTFQWNIDQELGLVIAPFANGMPMEGEVGPLVPANAAVSVTYQVTNTGNSTLYEVTLDDTMRGSVPQLNADSDESNDGMLSPGESWEFTVSEIAKEGPMHTAATVSGISATGQMIVETDSASFTGFMPDDQQPPTSCVPGDSDLDDDGQVGFSDFLLLSAQFGNVSVGNSADVDCNGVINFADFLQLSGDYGKVSETRISPTAVDEIFGQREDALTGRRPRNAGGRQVRA